MNETKGRFIYVTPYITEVERIETACGFAQPVKYSTTTPKLTDFRNLISKGKNIVTTHSLLNYMTDDMLELVHKQGYTLIMDEVHEVVNHYNINPEDLKVLLAKYVDVGEKGILKWKEEYADYDEGKYDNEKRLCEMGCLVHFRKSLIWLFPMKIFDAFKDVYLLTYLWNGQCQKYYYDLFGIEYKYLYVDSSTYHFSETKTVERFNYKELVKIVDNPQMNRWGDADKSLSKEWYKKPVNFWRKDRLRSSTYNYFRNMKILYDETTGKYTKCSSKNAMWTTFIDFKSEIADKGYSKGFIACNCRATNMYRYRTCLAYLVNRFLSPYIKGYFVSCGIDVDEDLFAISELVQFIWRSGIRDGKHISIYIPSKRMRTLLVNWLDSLANV